MSALESMQKLDTDYLDLYLLHFPNCPSNVSNPLQVIQETWRELELLLDEEKVRSIGVSNFQVDQLEDLVGPETSGMWPHVNQCEFHPYQHPKELMEFCEENRIQFGGFCPLAKGKILQDKPILDLARTLQKSPAQILIRWSIQHNALTIPKSTKKEHIRENFLALDFELPDFAMEILDNLHTNMRLVDIDNIQQRLDQDLPDGYKMKNFSCILPPKS